MKSPINQNESFNDSKYKHNQKKNWTKPVINSLEIKTDTMQLLPPDMDS